MVTEREAYSAVALMEIWIGSAIVALAGWLFFSASSLAPESHEYIIGRLFAQLIGLIGSVQGHVQMGTAGGGGQAPFSKAYP